MTKALATFDDLTGMARHFVQSGFFADIRDVAQAVVKIQAGQELGLPPFAAMTGIHIIKGKAVLGSNVIATLVANDPRYGYRVKVANDQQCVIRWFEHGEEVGESAFTRKEAADGNVDKAWDKQSGKWKDKPTWKAYPSDMLFARAISRGARRYAPGIFGGAPVYTPDEFGAEVDEDGAIVGEIMEHDNAPEEQFGSNYSEVMFRAPVDEPTPAPSDNGKRQPAQTLAEFLERLKDNIIVTQAATDDEDGPTVDAPYYRDGRHVLNALKKCHLDPRTFNTDPTYQKAWYRTALRYAQLRAAGADSDEAVDAIDEEEQQEVG